MATIFVQRTPPFVELLFQETRVLETATGRREGMFRALFTLPVPRTGHVASLSRCHFHKATSQWVLGVPWRLTGAEDRPRGEALVFKAGQGQGRGRGPRS